MDGQPACRMLPGAIVGEILFELFFELPAIARVDIQNPTEAKDRKDR